MPSTALPGVPGLPAARLLSWRETAHVLTHSLLGGLGCCGVFVLVSLVRLNRLLFNLCLVLAGETAWVAVSASVAILVGVAAARTGERRAVLFATWLVAGLLGMGSVNAEWPTTFGLGLLSAAAWAAVRIARPVPAAATEARRFRPRARRASAALFWVPATMVVAAITYWIGTRTEGKLWTWLMPTHVVVGGHLGWAAFGWLLGMFAGLLVGLVRGRLTPGLALAAAIIGALGALGSPKPNLGPDVGGEVNGVLLWAGLGAGAGGLGFALRWFGRRPAERHFPPAACTTADSSTGPDGPSA